MILLIKSWLIYWRERFSPLAYFPLLLLFISANGLYFVRNENLPLSFNVFIITSIIILSAFFRHRLMADIRHYAHDVKVHPTYPLPRGLISLASARHGVGICILIELILAALLSPWGFIVHALAIGYSLLSFEEFFFHELLRKHPTLQAYLQNFVCFLLALSSVILITDLDFSYFHFFHWMFLLSSWPLFNLLSFSLRLYSDSEEKAHANSLSRRWGTISASTLTLLQPLIGILIISITIRNPINLVRNFDFLFELWLGLCLTYLPYIIKPNNRHTRWMRLGTRLYLLAHFGTLAYLYQIA